ncbi:MAG: 16S rRNA (cytidine(1402)-2'-O)-methyltransferase [candidate division Zixibacteria bacterium]|nr:16S rRNA (cytidine(1402)-2'-O)-methyltransferase [candidate division Zixibacteria bacterium]
MKNGFHNSGTLYLLSTPIGNLEDITLRALRVLKEVDLIAAEDTRKTGILLKNYSITNRLTSYHDYNKEKKAPWLLQELKSGKSIALVSDAGTPGISDPAYLMVKYTIEEEIRVESIPGPTAFVSALVVSGLPTDKFIFEGFLPAKSGKRRKRITELSDEKRTMIFYESPHRFLDTITDFILILGDRRVCIARELTKKFEEVKRGRLSKIREYFETSKIRGEIVIIVEGRL